MRPWLPDDQVARIDFALIVGHAKAEVSLMKLALKRKLSLEEQLIIANLNAYCVLFWYEPIALQVGYPELTTTVAEMAIDILNVEEFPDI